MLYVRLDARLDANDLDSKAEAQRPLLRDALKFSRRQALLPSSR